MAGRRVQKSSKKPFVIFLIAVAVIIAGIVCLLVFFNVNSHTPDNKATTVVTTTSEQIVSVTSNSAEEEQITTTSVEAEKTTQAEPAETQKVVVPTKNGGEIGYFNATYVPYKAIDTMTNEECSLREVFGSSFGKGTITFNEDGTFTDSVISSSANSGAYAAEGEAIVATYSNDKNMTVSAVGWDNGTPKELIINYGGYDVYFNM